MPGFTRREFFQRAFAAGLAGGLVLSGLGKQAGAAGRAPVGTVIDLTRCDGCRLAGVPACVRACREENQRRFPRPVDDIGNYWPQKKKEDWSDKRDLITRLTPYNWTFVQKVEVEHGGKLYRLAIPRRCMHCDNPPCANLCPFSAQRKTPEGPVVIDPDLCLGGAKCRQVCPWGIPARQAGVGLYLKIAPRFAGGGVMYKCNLCYDRLKAGRPPACVEACPRQALLIGSKERMRALARERAGQVGGYIYGERENGGTSTFYVSPVPFEKIHAALMQQKAAQANPSAPGFPGMPVGVGNYLDSVNGLALGMAVAPVAGAVAAGVAAYRTMKGDE